MTKKPTPDKPKFTVSERAVIDVLLDGMPHSAEELAAAYDSEATPDNLAIVLTRIRKKINPTGHDVIPERWQGKVNGRHKRAYRLVRLTRPDHL